MPLPNPGMPQDSCRDQKKERKKLEKSIASYRTQCDYLEVRIEDTKEIYCSFTGRDIDTCGSKQERGGYVRVLKDGSWGMCSFNNLETVNHFIAQAMEAAQLAGKGTISLAPVPICKDTVSIHLIHDPRQVPLSEKIAVLEQYNKIILTYHPAITSSLIRYREKYSRIHFCNSEGTSLVQERMDLSGALVAIGIKNGITQTYQTAFGSSDDFNIVHCRERETEEICQTVAELLDAPKVINGTYTVILDPHLTGVFVHEAFGHLSEGDNVYEDENLQEIMKLGAVFGRECLSIYDTGLTRGSRGWQPYDDEGVPASKTYLIKQGILTDRLHTRETAGKMGESATGNARALSYRFPPLCRMTNTCVEKHASSLEEMLHGIKLGIYAIHAKGGETNGELFTFTAGKGYMIRNGTIAEMVRDVSLSGNVFTTLRDIDLVGNDQMRRDTAGGCGKDGQVPLPVSHEGPHIRIRNVVVG